MNKIFATLAMCVLISAAASADSLVDGDAEAGKAKAITATARKLAILVYRMLRYQLAYRELSSADYDQLQRSRIIRGLRRRAASLGIELVDTNTGLVM